jgi:hypothetical protein
LLIFSHSTIRDSPVPRATGSFPEAKNILDERVIFLNTEKAISSFDLKQPGMICVQIVPEKPRVALHKSLCSDCA